MLAIGSHVFESRPLPINNGCNNADLEAATTALNVAREAVECAEDAAAAAASMHKCETCVQQCMARFEGSARALYEQQRGSLREATSCASALAEQVSATLQRLRRSERLMMQRRDALARVMRAALLYEEQCRQAVIRVEEQRRAQSSRVARPQWNVPHHFHLTAVAHHRGTQQRHIGEIAAMFPGHLRIMAAARRTALLPSSLFPVFKSAQEKRQQAEDAFSAVSTDLQFHRESVDRLECRLKELQRRLGSTARRDLRARQCNLRLYRSIKHRYFAALNVVKGYANDNFLDESTIDQDELIEPTMSWDGRIDKVLNMLDLHRIGCKQAWDALQNALSSQRRLFSEVNQLRSQLDPAALAALVELHRQAELEDESIVSFKSFSDSESEQSSSAQNFRADSTQSSPSISSLGFFSSSPVSPSIMALG